MTTDDVYENDIFTINGVEFIRDFEKEGMVYARQIKDGVAYLPGIKMAASEFYKVAVSTVEEATQ